MALNSDPKLTRSESSRINGAKSHGPTSPEGKARSCLNRTTHGMRSARVVLINECQQTYDDLSSRFLTLFGPKDAFEDELLSNMINARWRLRRLETAESANLELAIAEARPDFEQKFENLQPAHEQALAYRAIAQQLGKTDLMGRYEDRLHRVFERSYRLLAKHRGKTAALPALEVLREAEDGLPEDNFQPAIPLQAKPDHPHQAIEPDPPPADPVRLKPQPIQVEEPGKPGRQPQPLCMHQEDYDKFEPVLTVLNQDPLLREAFLEAVAKRKAIQDKAA